MSTKINLNSIRKYNPGLLKDGDVIANFIARQKTFTKLLDHLKQEGKNSIPQHHIIIGQRGMGKTTLLKRIEVELRLDPKLSKRYAPLQYPEEQYNIDRLSKFWLNTIDVLIDYLEISDRKELVSEYDRKMQSLISVNEESELSESAYNLFTEIIKTIKRRPVLLIDNIDELFAGLKDEEQWQLREKLSKSNAPIFIGASAAPFDSVFEYKQAFYDYFKLTILEPLNSIDFHALISILADNIEDEEIRQSFQINKNRIEALYRLAGGNIRTAIILFSSLHTGFGDNVGDDLEKLLDEATPIYKSRVEELPDQLKTIIDAIALHWHPIDLKNLREATSLDNNTLSPQVRRLRKLGWITKTESNKTKGGKYEMTERFFNVWYLMRRTTRRHKRDITCLSRFFEEYFGSQGDSHARTLLNKPIRSSNDVTYRLALSEIVQDNILKEELLQYTRKGLKSLSENDPSILSSFNDSKDDEKPATLALKLIENGQYQEAKTEYLKSIEIDNQNANIWNNLGKLYYRKLNEYSKAKDAYLKAIELDDKFALPWNGLGNLYQDHLNDYSKSKDAYLKAIDLDDKFALPWNGLGNLYQDHLKEYSKAKEAYLKAIELDDKFTYPLSNLGNLYQFHLKDYSKAKDAYLNAIELDNKNPNPWYGLGKLYHYHSNEYSKAKDAYLKVIQLDTKNAYPWNSLGVLYIKKLNNYSKAEEAYLKAIELDDKFSYPYNNIGNIYLNQKKEYVKAKDAYLKAIELDDKYASPWLGLGSLYHNHLNEYSKAKDAYLKAIDLDAKLASPWNSLGNLYKDHLNEYSNAKDAYLNAIDLDDEFALPWNGLGDLYNYQFNEYSKAKDAYLKAIELDNKFAVPWCELGYLFDVYLNEDSKAKHAYLKAIELDDKYANPWNGLGHLYHYSLKEYSKAKDAYYMAIQLENKNKYSWTSLGNLYQDYLGEFTNAKEAYFKVLELDPTCIPPSYNLLYLFRDILNLKEDAKNIFQSLSENSEANNLDIYFLNESLFHIHDNNFGMAKSSLITAIERLDDKIPDNTFIGWQRYVSVAVNLGFGENAIQIFKENGIDVLMRPYYEAAIALQNNDDLHFQDIAAELRETAKEIYEFMKKYKSNLYNNRVN